MPDELTPVKEKEIATFINKLDRAASKLGDSVDVLRGTLIPILPETEKTADWEEPTVGALTPLWRAIKSIISKLDATNEKVVSLSDDVEL